MLEKHWNDWSALISLFVTFARQALFSRCLADSPFYDVVLFFIEILLGNFQIFLALTFSFALQYNPTYKCGNCRLFFSFDSARNWLESTLHDVVM